MVIIELQEPQRKSNFGEDHSAHDAAYEGVWKRITIPYSLWFHGFLMCLETAGPSVSSMFP